MCTQVSSRQARLVIGTPIAITWKAGAMPHVPEPKGRRYLPVAPASPLAGVIASNLANAHGTGQWATDLAALTLILGHNVLIHALAVPRHQPAGSRPAPPDRSVGVKPTARVAAHPGPRTGVELEVRMVQIGSAGSADEVTFNRSYE